MYEYSEVMEHVFKDHPEELQFRVPLKTKTKLSLPARHRYYPLPLYFRPATHYEIANRLLALRLMPK